MGTEGGTIGDYPKSTPGSDDRHKKTKQLVQKPEKTVIENLIIRSDKFKILLLDQKN